MAVVKNTLKSAQKSNTPLELKSYLSGLFDAGRINQEDLDYVATKRRAADERDHHILHYLADLKLEDRLSEGRTLDIEALTMELSKQSGQDYCRIDPLKIDAAAMTQVMSHAFAKRHKILAVEVNAFQVTVASAEPYLNTWESDLAHTSQKQIKRVVSNPLEIQRLTTEFYSLSSSIRGASAAGMPIKKGMPYLTKRLFKYRLMPCRS